MTSPATRYTLVPAKRLRPHEHVDEADVEHLADRMRKDGIQQSPIVVDQATYTILDGHHRFAALQRLGCDLVACYLVDYTDPTIQVERWEDGRPMDKEEIIDRAMSGDLLAIKTSRHTTLRELPARPTELSELRPQEGGA